MATTEERLQILKMIEQGKISAAEGADLLKSLERPTPQPAAQVEQEEEAADVPKSRLLCIRIMDSRTGKKKVNINVPLGLVNVGLKMGARFAPEMSEDKYNQVLASIKEAMRSGERGKIIEVTNEDGEQVEVFVE